MKQTAVGPVSARVAPAKMVPVSAVALACICLLSLVARGDGPTGDGGQQGTDCTGSEGLACQVKKPDCASCQTPPDDEPPPEETPTDDPGQLYIDGYWVWDPYNHVYYWVQLPGWTTDPHHIPDKPGWEPEGPFMADLSTASTMNGGIVRAGSGDVVVAWSLDGLSRLAIPPGPRAGGHGGSVLADVSVQPLVLTYRAQTNVRRMTGNWDNSWDVWLAPQSNGDVLYYGGHGRYSDRYVWDPTTQTFASPAGFFDRIVHNENGTWTKTEKTGWRSTFDSSGRLTSVLDPFNNTTTVTRDSQNRIIQVGGPDGAAVSFTYGSGDRVSQISDNTGRSYLLSYDADGQMTSITSPSTTFFDLTTNAIVTRGKTTTFGYTSGSSTPGLNGNLATVTDDLGVVVLSCTYDSSDRVVQISQPRGTWSLTYTPSVNRTRVQDPMGHVAEYTTDSNSAITRQEIFTQSGLGGAPLRPGEPLSYTTVFERNAGCNCSEVTRLTLPDGSQIGYSYDAWGNRLERTTAPGAGVPGTAYAFRG